MKKLIIPFMLMLFSVLTAGAQDRIVRMDSTMVEARVTEITPTEVRYKRFSNPDGPTYILPVEQIRSIIYPNGETDVFNQEAVLTDIEVNAATFAPQPVAATSSVPGRVYAIGDYYEDGAVRGVVCQLSEDKMHGLILSLDEVSLPWTTGTRAELQLTGASDSDDGRANMRAVERYIAENNLLLSDFPAFEWCAQQGEGWYLPSINELLTISANYNGGVRTVVNREARLRFNEAMRAHGGKRMDRLAYYYSSTERDGKRAICSHVDFDPPFVGDVAKNTKALVRAVHRF